MDWITWVCHLWQNITCENMASIQNTNMIRKLYERSFEWYKVVNRFFDLTHDVVFIHQMDNMQSRSAHILYLAILHVKFSGRQKLLTIHSIPPCHYTIFSISVIYLSTQSLLWNATWPANHHPTPFFTHSTKARNHKSKYKMSNM